MPRPATQLSNRKQEQRALECGVQRRSAMPIARITSQGLAAIAVAVGLLWGGILAENRLVQSAYRNRIATFHELRMLRDGLRKVNAPVAPVTKPGKPIIS